MSEDRLDEALNAMKNENPKDEELAEARDRVWKKLTNPANALCDEFRLHFGDYLRGTLENNRRLLLEDHLSRCPGCREALAARKGERQAAVIPIQPNRKKMPQWGRWAVAAAAVACVLYLGKPYFEHIIPWGNPRVTVASVTGKLYRVPQGLVEANASIGQDEIVRTGPGSRAVLRLADGSLIDVNERTELSIHTSWSGRIVHLQGGDIILRAARQRNGYLRVQTRDSVASVKGTIFAVSSGLAGTLVSVIEGSVAVAAPNGETVLRPGEQAASNPALIGSVEDAVSWSPDAETYLGILASLASIQKQLASLPAPTPRTSSQLLGKLPPNTVIYGAIPNVSDTIHRAMEFAEQQSAANPFFSQWWSSPQGLSLRRLLLRVEETTHMLGDEIVYAYSTGMSEKEAGIPMILAEVLPGKQSQLAEVLNAAAATKDGPALSYRIDGPLLVASDSAAHLNSLLTRLGEGATTPFAAQIGERYRRGAGWLLAIDLEIILAKQKTAQAEKALTGAQQAKYLFFERRDVQATEENTVTLTFKGPRMGMASFLANSGSAGAAEYIPGDVIAAGYVSTREPKQLYDEMVGLLTRLEPSASDRLTRTESELGAGFINDLAASIGTESAIGLESISTKGPSWMAAVLVYHPETLDDCIRKMVEACNTMLAREGRKERIIFGRETADGRTWTSIKYDASPLSIVWTQDRGYMIAGSDRGIVGRALATRNGGSPLVWSQEFRQRLPVSIGLRPSAFGWLNTRGAFQAYGGLIPNPAIRDLLMQRDATLVAFGATDEQIRASSRTRISGLFMDMMLLQSLGRMNSGM